MVKNVTSAKKSSPHIWVLFNAESKVLGRLCTEISRVLLGKHAAVCDLTDEVHYGVIIINAEKVVVTGKKKMAKLYYKHSGRPGGLTVETFMELQKRLPFRIIERSVKGMLPKNHVGRKLVTLLKVYKGSEHPHNAQNPREILIP